MTAVTQETASTPAETLMEKMTALLAKVPADQKAAAADVLAQYGPRFFELSKEDAYGYLRRIMHGDIQAVVDLDMALSNDEFIARVKANTARWSGVSAHEVEHAELTKKIAIGIAPVVISILAAFVGL